MTAWATPEEELTPLEGCRLLEELEAVELGDVVAPVGLEGDVEVEAPGMVWALTALKTPTAATAAIAVANVRRFSSPSAASRDRMRCSMGWVLSMGSSLRVTAEPNVGSR